VHDRHAILRFDDFQFSSKKPRSTNGQKDKQTDRQTDRRTDK